MTKFMQSFLEFYNAKKSLSIDIGIFGNFLIFSEKSKNITINQEKLKNNNLKVRISFRVVEFKLDLSIVKPNIDWYPLIPNLVRSIKK